ncbi:MAG: alpha/beta fold hydrolase [Leptolyngbyaceae bacterium]|nr:alpha/beta fold hydrolase [Leptolyngbyaceae bacterium]
MSLLNPVYWLSLISSCSLATDGSEAKGDGVLTDEGVPRSSRGTRGFMRSIRKLMTVSGLVLGGVGFGSSAIAAEKVVVRLGPVEQTAYIEDLETFAQTGTVPERLKLYQPVLTEEVRYALSNRMYLDPEASNHLMDGLIQSESGKRVIELLGMAAPENTPEEFESALKTVAQETGSISVLGFLQAFPAETLTIDASSAIALVSQFNLPQWQSHALNSILERELEVETDSAEPFYTTFDPTLQGPDNVRHQTLTFRDRERRRTIPVDLYWSRWTTGPLVIISHGFGADRRFLNYLANHLASHGVTVASLEHPGSNVAWLAGITLGESGTGSLSEILPATEFIERPRDIQFLLDELARLNKYSTVLGDRLNTENVTVIGHSLGGYTALALAGAQINLPKLREFCNARSLMELSPADWLQCSAVDLPDQDYDLRDRRVTQVIAMSPVMGRIFDAEGLSRITIPTIITSASQDSITPSVHQQLLPFRAFSNSEDPSMHRLLVAVGATHLSMGDPENLNAAITQSIFLRERRWEDTELMRRMMKGLTLAFVKQQTPEAELYEPFLSSAYVQSWSTDSLALRFNDQISENLENWLQIATVPLERVVLATMPKTKQTSERSVLMARLNKAARILPLVLLIPPSQMSLAMLIYLKRKGQRKEKLPRLW